MAVSTFNTAVMFLEQLAIKIKAVLPINELRKPRISYNHVNHGSDNSSDLFHFTLDE
jgi:hypothetical protein